MEEEWESGKLKRDRKGSPNFPKALSLAAVVFTPHAKFIA
jgi:hypothetical protein